jgi:hypothetical protein
MTLPRGSRRDQDLDGKTNLRARFLSRARLKFVLSPGFLRSGVILVILASTHAFVSSAEGFAFLGDRRVEDPLIAGFFIPAPIYWSVPAVRPGPGLTPVRTLNVTFNTAAAFAVPVPDQPAILNSVMTWDNRQPVVANNNFSFPAGGLPPGTPMRVLGGQSYDLESILLHEIGHAIGLAHPNLADRVPAVDRRRDPTLGRATASTKGDNGRFDIAGVDGIIGNFNDNRGDDRSLNLVDRDNNPFNAFNGAIDKTTFKLDGPFATGGYSQTPTREVAAAGLAATGFAAIANLEAIMVQGARPNEIQRALTRDDLHGMTYLQAGPDQISGGQFAADDYVFSLVFNAAGVANAGGAAPAGVQILVNNTRLAGPLGRTVFQRPFANAIVEYETDFDTESVLSQTDVWLDGPVDSFGTTIQFVDVTFFDTLGPSLLGVPAPASLWLFLAGGVIFVAMRRRSRKA